MLWVPGRKPVHQRHELLSKFHVVLRFVRVLQDARESFQNWKPKHGTCKDGLHRNPSPHLERETTLREKALMARGWHVYGKVDANSTRHSINNKMHDVIPWRARSVVSPPTRGTTGRRSFHTRSFGRDASESKRRKDTHRHRHAWGCASPSFFFQLNPPFRDQIFLLRGHVIANPATEFTKKREGLSAENCRTKKKNQRTICVFKCWLKCQ